MPIGTHAAGTLLVAALTWLCWRLVAGHDDVSPLLVGLVFGEAYARHHDLLVLLMAVGVVLFAASFLGYGLTATRRFAVQLPLFAATTLVCAGACLWLVPAYGLAGAAYAWGGAMLVELVATWIILELALRKGAAGVES